MLYKVWVSRKLSVLVGVTIGVGAVAGTCVLANSTTSKPDWREYNAFNESRGWLYDSPVLDCSVVGKEMLAGAQWSMNDYFMMKSGFMEKPTVYDSQRCLYLLSYSGIKNWDRLKIAIRNVRGSLHEGGRWVLPLVALVLLCLINNRDQWQRRIMLVSVLAGMALLIAISCVCMLKLRVTIPVIALVAVTGLWLTDAYAWKPKSILNLKDWRETAFIAFACVAIIGSLYGAGIKSRMNQRDISALAEKIDYLDAWRDKILILWSDMSLPIQNVSPFKSALKLRKAGSLYSTGWMSQSPYNTAILAAVGERDVLQALLDSDSFRLVLEEPSSSWLGNLAEFYQAHYGAHVRFECEGTFGGGVGDVAIKVYKVSHLTGKDSRI